MEQKDFHREVFFERGRFMLQRFYPDEYVDSAYEIDYEALYEKGHRGVIFDIDNTLVPHGAPADQRSKALMARLTAIGYQVMMLSNNKEPRVKMFCDAVSAAYIHRANKPFEASYRRAMKQMGTIPGNTLFVGDQLFTDVWGAKKVGMTTYLVAPIHPKEEIQIVIKRFFEKIVLYFYKRERAK